MAQVVAGAGGDAHEPDVVPGRDGGDQRLGAVAAGHPEHVGAAGHGPLGQGEQVVAGGQDHGLDAAPPGLGDQVVALDLAAAGLGVHEQDRPPRRPHCGSRRGAALERLEVTPQRVPGRHSRDRHQHDHPDQLEQLAVGHHQQQRHHQGHDRHQDGDQPAPARPGDRIGSCRDRHAQAQEGDDQRQRVPQQGRDADN
jgi:hypothetical protein